MEEIDETTNVNNSLKIWKARAEENLCEDVIVWIEMGKWLLYVCVKEINCMSDNKKRKFSLFVSSTYEDLKEERQAVMGVAIENDFIPVGMEQFHAAPASQWDVIKKMIDESDFYLLIIGGRYGSIDESVNVSYTEKEYNYVKNMSTPVLVLIEEPGTIRSDKMDFGDDKHDKYELQKRLDEFRSKVKNDGNTVDFFDGIDSLKYKVSQTLKNAKEYADSSAGWVRYNEVIDIINEKIAEEEENKSQLNSQIQNQFEDLKEMLTCFGNKLAELEEFNNNSWGMISETTNEEINQLFHVKNGSLIIGNPKSKDVFDDVNIDNIPLDSAILLIYAAAGDGRIMKIRTLGSPTFISPGKKEVMVDLSPRESARWVEALQRLIDFDWVTAADYKGEVYDLTKTGYDKADWLKSELKIDTDNDPLEELKRLEQG